jgi:hypothetical protein
LEEVQSDFGQSGKKQGFKVSEQDKNKKIELDKCQWKPRAKYSNYEQLRPFLDLCLDNPEFDEIKNVINVLGNP